MRVKKNTKRVLAFVMVMAMGISLMPFAFAEDPVTLTETETYEYKEGKTEVVIEETTEVTEFATDAVLVETEITETQPSPSPEIKEDAGDALVGKEDVIVQKSAEVDGSTKADVITVNPESNLTDPVISGGKEGCEHKWSETYTEKQTATCAQYGVIEYKCTCEGCNAVKEVLVEKTGHNPNGEGKLVACAEKPYIIYTCSVCGETYKVFCELDAEQKKPHDMHDGVCSECGYTESTSGTVEDVTTTTTGGTPTKKVENAAEYTFADETLTVYKGTGDTGEIPDYETNINIDANTVLSVENTDATPWAGFADQVKNLVVKNGITRIGDWAFGMLSKLKTVVIEGDNVSIGDYAFAEDTALETVAFTSTKANVTYDNANCLVEYETASGTEVKDTGSTAYFGDGNITIDYNCQNKDASAQKKTAFAGVSEQYGCYHNNVVKIAGKAPTEKESGLSDGYYCNDCKTWVTYQYKIFPNGKETTGKYKFTEYKDWKEIPEALQKMDEYNTIAKLETLKDDFVDSLNEAMKEEYKVELLKDHYKIYNIEMLSCKTEKEPETHIINIPYPTDTNPSTHDYVVVQLNEDGEFEELEIFKTNKGIQVEVETLMPIGVAWKLI